MSKEPRILVGTLYSGENEFEAMKASLQEQTYSHWKHVVYKNLPNKEAHDRLYRTFMDQQDNFDLFLKLDADMVLKTREGLNIVANIFKQKPDLDHLTLAVHDWYSDELIDGLHTFSNKVTWSATNDERFVDPAPDRKGIRLKIWHRPAPIVNHSPDPHPLQAFRFGLHRALKVVQSERPSVRLGKSRLQWDILKKCWKKFLASSDKRLGLACLAATLTINEKIIGVHYDEEGKELKKEFKKYEMFSSSKIKTLIQRNWKNVINRELMYLKGVGVSNVLQQLPVYTAKCVYRKLQLKP
jgi:hypothetical protein